MLLFVQILIILLATKLAGDLSQRLGQPAVLGKLVIGIVIGPAMLGFIEDSEIIKELSEIGVLLLMFIAGLESDLKMLNESKKSAVAVAVGGVIFPFIGGFLGGKFIGMDQTHSLFLGLLFTATSVSISVQTLKEIGQFQSRESNAILGAALVDDVLAVVLLAVMMGLLTGEEVSIGWVLGEKVLFFALILLLGWKFVPWFMKRFASLQVSETVISAGLILCFVFAFLAEEMGIAGIIGAFSAGIAVSQTKFKKEVEEKVQPLAYAFFVPVFFVSIGLSITFEGIGSQAGFIALLTVIAVLTKLVGAALGARLTGFNNKSSIQIGAGMISRGEVALILASLGLQTQLLSQQYYTGVIIVVILTTLITPPLLKVLFKEPHQGEEKQNG